MKAGFNRVYDYKSQIEFIENNCFNYIYNNKIR